MKDADDLRTAAAQLFDRLVKNERSLAALVAGAKATYNQILSGMGPSIGQSNIRMLMARAVHKAASHYPSLRDISVYEDDIDAEAAIVGKKDGDYDEMRAAFEELNIAFWENIANLVGKNVAKVLMREVVENEERRHRQEDKK